VHKAELSYYKNNGMSHDLGSCCHYITVGGPGQSMVDTLALVQAFLQVVQFSSLNIIPPVLCTHSFIVT